MKALMRHRVVPALAPAGVFLAVLLVASPALGSRASFVHSQAEVGVTPSVDAELFDKQLAAAIKDVRSNLL